MISECVCVCNTRIMYYVNIKKKLGEKTHRYSKTFIFLMCFSFFFFPVSFLARIFASSFFAASATAAYSFALVTFARSQNSISNPTSKQRQTFTSWVSLYCCWNEFKLPEKSKSSEQSVRQAAKLEQQWDRKKKRRRRKQIQIWIRPRSELGTRETRQQQ